MDIFVHGDNKRVPFGSVSRRLGGGVSTDARTAVILGIKAECVGIGFWHAEGLVTVPCGVMAHVDLFMGGTTRIVLHHAKVIFRAIIFGVTGDRLEFHGAALEGFLFADDLVGLAASLIIAPFRRFAFCWTGLHARKFEGVHNGLALLASMATLGNFCVVGSVEEGHSGAYAILNPEIDDGNLGAMHASRCEVGLGKFVHFQVRFFETLGLSEGTRVILCVYGRNSLIKGVFDLELYMGRVLESDLNRNIGFGINSFSLDGNQDGIRYRTRIFRGRGIGLVGGRNSG